MTKADTCSHHTNVDDDFIAMQYIHDRNEKKTNSTHFKTEQMET